MVQSSHDTESEGDVELETVSMNRGFRSIAALKRKIGERYFED